MEYVNFQRSEKEEEFNMNCKITIYAISLGKFQVYRVTWVLVVQVFVFLCILFEENTSPDHATTGRKAREKIQ